MSINESKQLYDNMLKAGDLKEMFPSMSGNWEKDKTSFIELHTLNDSLDFEEDLDDNYFYDDEDGSEI